jgi:hypothetical protein
MLGLVKENWDENRVTEETGVEVAEEDWVDTSHFGLLYLWALCRYLHRDYVRPDKACRGQAPVLDVEGR